MSLQVREEVSRHQVAGNDESSADPPNFWGEDRHTEGDGKNCSSGVRKSYLFMSPVAPFSAGTKVHPLQWYIKRGKLSWRQ